MKGTSFDMAKVCQKPAIQSGNFEEFCFDALGQLTPKAFEHFSLKHLFTNILVVVRDKYCHKVVIKLKAIEGN